MPGRPTTPPRAQHVDTNGQTHPLPTMRTPARLAAAFLALSGALATPVALANTAKPAGKAVAKTAKPAQKAAPATPRARLNNQAKGLALATTTVAQISAGQMDVAARVLVGAADCEFKQQVHVHPVDGHPGHFHVGFQGKRYTMVPQETATGAVRLEDPRAGTVWLQIPMKSMLMDARRGQRLVDGCLHSEQRAAVAAAAGAAPATALGISAAPAAPLAPAPAVAASAPAAPASAP